MMKLLLCLTILTVCSIQFTQGGIYRRYVRRTRPRPHPYMDMPYVPMMVPNDHYFSRRDYHSHPQLLVPTPWPSILFRRPRSPWPWWAPAVGLHHPPRMSRHFRQPHERQDTATVPHFHHRPAGHVHVYSPSPTMRYPMASTPVGTWRPAGYKSPMERDPTYDYAPPSLERVRFHSENRRTTARAHTISSTPIPHRPVQVPPGYTVRPSILKMLTHKQRPYKRPISRPPHHRYPPTNMPYHHHHHNQIIFPDDSKAQGDIPSMAYFRPNDAVRRPSVIPYPFGYPPRRHPPPPPGRPTTETPGKSVEVSSVELGSGEVSSVVRPKPKGKTTSVGSKEYIFTVVGYKGPSSSSTPKTTTFGPISTTKKSAVFHAIKTTPSSLITTHNTAVKPSKPTESLQSENHYNHRHQVEDMDSSSQESEQIAKIIKGKDEKESHEAKTEVEQPVPIFANSFNILDSVKEDDESGGDSSAENDENEIPASVIEISNNSKKPRPVFNNAIKFPSSTTESYKTSTSVSISVSKTDDTTTKEPPTTTSTPTTTTTPKPTKFPRLPTMPTYKKKPTPVYARKNGKNPSAPFGKYASASSSSTLSKEMNGSGEIVVITAGRSKVKEYKPQFINGEGGPLISFDKIVEGSSSSTNAPEIKKSTTPSPSITTTKSPLQEFDPMQLLHSWFSKSD